MFTILLRQFKGGLPMTRNESIICYILAIATFKKWLGNGFITEAEFREIESLAANRHGLPKNSIYR